MWREVDITVRNILFKVIWLQLKPQYRLANTITFHIEFWKIKHISQILFILMGTFILDNTINVQAQEIEYYYKRKPSVSESLKQFIVRKRATVLKRE